MGIERHTDKSDRTELQIAGVSLHPETQEPQIILRNPATGAYTRLSVGPYEAGAILTEIHGTGEREPFAYDSFVELLRVQDLYALCVEVDTRPDGRTYFWYTDGSTERSVVMRSSDGIALATRLEVPIYARGRTASPPSTTPQRHSAAPDRHSVPGAQSRSSA